MSRQARHDRGQDKKKKYVDILTEAGFKAVFGVEKNKDVLIDLLNVLLPEHRRVHDLSYATRRFRDRHEYDLAPVYFIGLLNTEIPKSDRSDGSIWGDRFVSEYTFREKVSNEVVDETIFLNFVELHRFKKELHDCVSLVDKWCYSLKHVGSLDRLPEELRVRAFERLFEACEIAKFTPEEKLRYEHDMITERDYDNIIYTAKAEGRTEGKAEGLAEGEAKGKTDVARAMKAKGIEISLIAELTGLSVEEIQRL